MDSSTGWILGVDGFPLGTHAALVGEGVLTEVFAVVDGRGRPLDLEHRVTRAIDEAASGAGRIEFVRLACLDDGEAGQCLARIGHRLMGAGIRFDVIDTGAGIRTSRGRACRAAQVVILG